MTPELQTRVAELLEQARIKRSASSIALGDSNDKRARELKAEALVLEGAANDIDRGHKHPAWHTEHDPRATREVEV